MRVRAAVFDLFGTLIEDLAGDEYATVFARSAALLSVDAGDFRQRWVATSRARNTGRFNAIEENIDSICRDLGAHPARGAIELAARARRDYVSRVMMAPRPDAAGVLADLRERGVAVGLISDCGPEVPTIWPDTPLAALIDVAVFSCSVGMKKPDRRVYHLAAARLGVRAEDCVFVGNGGSQELDGAREAGMRAVLIGTEGGAGPHFIDGVLWEGDSIAHLAELSDFLEER
jgi:putative hydrolase of the HAD superfamily